MEEIRSALMADIQTIRNQSPLILNLTNSVAMDFTANALLALGASPIMSHAIEEFADLIHLSDAIVINMGTLDQNFNRTALKAVKIATKLQKKVVFDPVGAGATQFRTQFAKDLLHKNSIAVVRGNASEIGAIFGHHTCTKGVDSLLSTDDVFGAMKETAQCAHLTLVASGETDYIVSKKHCIAIEHGTPMMTKVTAMGCVATSLIGAFLAVSSTSIQASLNAMLTMGIAGEIAYKTQNGPGSYRANFLDALFNLQKSDFADLKIKFL